MLPEPFAVWLLEQAGLNPRAYRAAAIQRRVAACLRYLRVDSGIAARQLLERHPTLIPSVLNVLLIGVTEFFRDRAVFDHLRRVSIPELTAGRGGLRVLSAGASTGHELCSAALLVAEAGALDRSDFLGVDCRPEAIQKARRGVFPAEAVASLERDWLERYFEPASGEYRLRSRVSKRLSWKVQDLLTFRAHQRWDLILFRNVAIYLNSDHATQLWENLHAQLSPGGLLATGKAERPPVGLAFSRVGPCLYRKEQRA